METGELIEALKADAGEKPAAMPRVWLYALLAGAVIAAAVFFSMLGPRADIADAARTMRFDFKFVVTLALFATSLTALSVLARPDGGSRWIWLILLAPVLLVAAVMIEMMMMPMETMGARWMGSNSMICMGYIPLIGLGPLIAFLLGLRHGAPTRPALAGAVAGLVAGGLAATFYASHCIDDSPLFVATWYTVAVAVLALLGALGAKLFARW